MHPILLFSKNVVLLFFITQKNIHFEMLSLNYLE